MSKPILAVFLFAGFCCFACAQNTLDTIDIAKLRTSFNSAKDKVRIVTIVAPWCGACINGQDFINDMFKYGYPNDQRLRCFSVWTATNGNGTWQQALSETQKVSDARYNAYWDPNMNLGIMYKQPLNLNPNYALAWDVYMVYKTGVTWDNSVPPVPTFWMHQLGEPFSVTGADPNLFMDEQEFADTVASILKTTGVEETAREVPFFEVYPVLNNGTFAARITGTAGLNAEFSAVDVTGRQISLKADRLSEKIFVISLEEAARPGVFFLKIKDRSGLSGVRRFVVTR